MNLDRLDAEILLRVLRDERVEAVAIEYYGHAQLLRLIEQLDALVSTPSAD